MKRILPALLLAILGIGSGASAGGPAIWKETTVRLMNGNLDGIAVSSDGHLSLAPLLKNVAVDALEGAGQGWSLAAGRDGVLFLGTGPRGLLFRIDPEGKVEELADLTEPMVSALAVLENGDVLAAGNPGGKIYRVSPEGEMTLWAELGERYIWSLVVAPNGKIFAATGENGWIFELNNRGIPEKFFDCPEPHVVSMAAHPDGGLVAGGSGGGRVYRIDEEAHGTVLYDDEMQEVTGVAIEKDGSILASLMASRPAAPGRPAVRFHLPSEVDIGSPSSRVDGLDEQEGVVVEGTIAGLESARPKRAPAVRGRVVRISSRGNTQELWRSDRESAFSLGKGAGGKILFGAGEPAALYSVDPGGVTLIARLKEAIAGPITVRRNSAVVLTSNPAAVYDVVQVHTEPGVYLSPVLDAGRSARWGAVHWRTFGTPGQVEFFARTGSSPSPDNTWTGWGPAMSRPTSATLDEPAARYMQWRLRFPGGMADPAHASVSDISVHYQPANRPPVLENFLLETGKKSGPGIVRFRWKTTDPDGDDVQVTIQYRLSGETVWTTGFQGKGEGSAGSLPDDLPEGFYEMRARASDPLSNSWRDARESAWVGPVVATVDRTPPVLSIQEGADGSRTVEAHDALSPLAGLELLSGNQVRLLGHPEDGVVDGPRETFTLPPLPPDGSSWVIQVTDAAGNVARESL